LSWEDERKKRGNKYIKDFCGPREKPKNVMTYSVNKSFKEVKS
jgi:hypothetical protein